MGASCSTSRTTVAACSDPCAICLDDHPTNAVRTACGHQFCADCITEWVEQHGGTCPTCRAEVSEVTYLNKRASAQRQQAEKAREAREARESRRDLARARAQTRARELLRERMIARAEREALRVMQDAFMRAEIERMRTGSWHHGVSDEEARARHHKRVAMRRRRAGRHTPATMSATSAMREQRTRRAS